MCRLVFIFLSGVYALNAIKYPVTPSVPSIPGSSNSNGTKKKIPTTEQYVKVTLGSGDSIQGNIQAPVEIRFKHYKSGLVFQKTITPADLKSISVQRYAYQNPKKKEHSTYYQFEPDKVEITLKNGRSYTLPYLFNFLRMVNIDTPDGKTTIYSFFADTFDEKKGWSEVESKDPRYHLNAAHPRVAVIFSFEAVAPSGLDQ